MKKKLFRIIDANLNRSREGLRVCEDISRFVLNSSGLSKDLKNVRHAISDIARREPLGPELLFESRDSAFDVGRGSKIPSEMRRGGLADIFAANMERAKESLRVLEEIFKLIDKKLSIKIACLRFKVYDIEKKAIKRIGYFK